MFKLWTLSLTMKRCYLLAQYLQLPNLWTAFQLNLDFKEVPSTLLRVEDWTIDFSARMTMPEHITLLEGRWGGTGPPAQSPGVGQLWTATHPLE